MARRFSRKQVRTSGGSGISILRGGGGAGMDVGTNDTTLGMEPSQDRDEVRVCMRASPCRRDGPKQKH